MDCDAIIKSSRSNGLSELLKVDHAIAVGVSLSDHPCQFLSGEGVSEFCHGVSQLRRSDESVPVAVEHSEEVPELLIRVGRLRRQKLRRHQRHELGELHQSVVVRIRPLNEALQLFSAGLQTQRSQKRTQLQLRQASVVVPIERAEDFPQLRDLLVGGLRSWMWLAFLFRGRLRVLPKCRICFECLKGLRFRDRIFGDSGRSKFDEERHIGGNFVTSSHVILAGRRHRLQFY
ncbi:hypothetical protein CR513_19377, partial [Mucuna pruriens]